MVVVVDRRADVVEHRRGPQQLALLGVAGMQPRAAPARPRSPAPAGRRAPCARRSGWYWAARLRTLASRTSAKSGSSWSASSVSKNAPSRRPAWVTSMASAPTYSRHGVDHRRRAEDEVPALGLDARDPAALAGGHVDDLVDQVAEVVASQEIALDAVAGELLREHRGGGEVADGAADAREPRAGLREPRRLLELLVDVGAERLDVLVADPVAVEEALGRDDGAEPPGARLRRVPVADARQLHRAAADVEREPVVERGRVDRGEVAVVGLALAGEDLHVQAGALLRRAGRTPRGCSPRGSRRSRAAGRARSRWRGRSGRRGRSSPARAPSARAGAVRPPPAPRRRARARRSRPSASTTRACGRRRRGGSCSSRGR